VQARARIALAALVFGAVLCVAAVLPWLTGAPALLRIAAVVVLLAGAFVFLFGVGLLRTIALDRAREASFDLDRAAADICSAHDGGGEPCGEGACSTGCALASLR
jgi:hypothetical protein